MHQGVEILILCERTRRQQVGRGGLPRNHFVQLLRLQVAIPGLCLPRLAPSLNPPSPTCQWVSTFVSALLCYMYAAPSQMIEAVYTPYKAL